MMKTLCVTGGLLLALVGCGLFSAATVGEACRSLTSGTAKIEECKVKLEASKCTSGDYRKIVDNEFDDGNIGCMSTARLIKISGALGIK